MVDRYRPSQIEKMKKEAKEKKSPLIYAQIGDYYSSEKETWGKCEKYLMKSIKCGGDHRAAYQLGYIYETRTKQTRDQTLLQGYENAMKKYYLMAALAGCDRARQRLGVYYFRSDVILGGKTPLQLLETAANNNYLPAIHHLGSHHPNINKRFVWAFKRYEHTGKPKDIERLIKLSNRHCRHRDYMKLGEMIGIENLGEVMEDINAPRNGICIDNCSGCKLRRKCIRLQCDDLVCHDCLFKIPKCPKCTMVI
ncbi:Hypothetical protein POVR1_LOCUS311 [uncultured virus]|nr:Hypothetical protein POVR1_LOCUS311 [uncultured virus]